MKQTTFDTIGIYRTTHDGARLAGELRLQSNGKVELEVKDEHHRRFLEDLVRDGVSSYSARRRVRANEGVAFLEAVLETVQTSYWHARDEKQPLLKHRERKRIPAGAH